MHYLVLLLPQMAVIPSQRHWRRSALDDTIAVTTTMPPPHSSTLCKLTMYKVINYAGTSYIRHTQINSLIHIIIQLYFVNDDLLSTQIAPNIHSFEYAVWKNIYIGRRPIRNWKCQLYAIVVFSFALSPHDGSVCVALLMCASKNSAMNRIYCCLFIHSRSHRPIYIYI